MALWSGRIPRNSYKKKNADSQNEFVDYKGSSKSGEIVRKSRKGTSFSLYILLAKV